MHIFIDESGTFSATDQPMRYSAVAALVVPDGALDAYEAQLTALKENKGVPAGDEVKLGALSEDEYFAFLESLTGIGGFVTCTSSDAGYNTFAKAHQAQQVDNFTAAKTQYTDQDILARIDRDAAAVAALSLQNYIELRCRCELNIEVMQSALRWMPGRAPQSLSTFKWSIDAKETAPNHFDETFKRLFTILTLDGLHHHPLMLVEGADYSGLAPFVAGGDTSVLAAGVAGPSLAADRLWLDNLRFADSKDVPGVQVIDLIVSGFRRVLRGAFADNDRAAVLLGALCIARNNDDAVKIVALGAGPDAKMHRETVRTLHLLSSKAMKP